MEIVRVTSDGEAQFVDLWAEITTLTTERNRFREAADTAVAVMRTVRDQAPPTVQTMLDGAIGQIEACL